MTICNEPIAPLTLRRATLLTAVDSPFLAGREGSAEDVALFVWLLSPDLILGDSLCAEARRRELALRIASYSATKARTEIRKYLAAAKPEIDFAARVLDSPLADIMSRR